MTLCRRLELVRSEGCLPGKAFWRGSLRCSMLLGMALSGLLGMWMPAGATAAVTELRIMSFNIWVSGGRSLSNCAEAIRRADADIVGLQECSPDAANTLATLLKYHRTSHSGIPILSRYPIKSTLNVSGGSGATIDLGMGQQIHFFNCHLTAYPYGPYTLKEGASRTRILQEEQSTRMPALTSLLSGMRPYLESSVPCFLTGDFNAPSHLDYADFPWPTSLACVNAGLIDTYREVHPGNRTFPGSFTFNDPGITWTPLTETEPNGVFDRIDFIYLGQGDGVTVLSSQEQDERNNVKPWPSDHRAVVTALKLPQPKAEKQASAPFPASGGIAEGAPVELSWLPGLDATRHRIYFGLQEPLPLFLETTQNVVSVSALRPGSTYLWRVDEQTPLGWVEGLVWSFQVRPVQRTEWVLDQTTLATTQGSGVLSFADGAVTSNLVTWGVSDGIQVPHLGGKPTGYLKIPKLTARGNGLWMSWPGSTPNGGGQYINQYTLAMDLLIPAPLGRTALFNTQPSNANDADLYALANGRIGSATLGYSTTGVARSNQWHRLIFTADLEAGWVRLAIDGTVVLNASTTLDGTYSLYSSLDAGPDLLLFNEGDLTGVYTHEVLLRNLMWMDQPLSTNQMTELAGPKPEGFLLNQANPRVSLAKLDGEWILSWTGGYGPYQIQIAPDLSGTRVEWQNLVESTFHTSQKLPAEIISASKATYFRVVAN